MFVCLFQIRAALKGRYTLGDKLQQHVVSQITPCVKVGRLVAATCRGDTSQRQIASCVVENFCENLCLRNRIFSLQQVAKKFAATKFCCSDKDFHKILQYTRSDLCVPTLTLPGIICGLGIICGTVQYFQDVWHCRNRLGNPFQRGSVRAHLFRFC